MGNGRNSKKPHSSPELIPLNVEEKKKKNIYFYYFFKFRRETTTEVPPFPQKKPLKNMYTA